MRKTALILLLALGGLLLATGTQISSIRGPLASIAHQAELTEITDRRGEPLGISYQNRWNSFNYLPLYQLPDFLRQAFLISEDRRFYQHHGVDWRALSGALWQNLRAGGTVRGASTISGQVVRIIHQRPRTLWSKWLELWESLLLEQNASKQEILEFYCNQLPYASNRRGVAQAASFYFNRDLSTLTRKEMLALVVLARAPSAYDLYRHPARADKAIQTLARQLHDTGLLSQEELDGIQKSPLKLAQAQLPVEATHFVRHVRNHDLLPRQDGRPLRTTLDGNLQRRVEQIISQRLKRLAPMKVMNAAALVADHRTGEILAWVVAGGDQAAGARNPNDQVDAVTTPRQPGSALKPFLYALALEKGWTAATLIDDSPLAESIGSGLHEFRNYSRHFYGQVSLREALGNSLNIPALRTIHYTGVAEYLDRLHQLGFTSLNRGAEIYNEGLALGIGEVTLLEMVQAYATLARGGEFRPLRWDRDDPSPPVRRTIFSPALSSLIGHILSDPWARRLEFGTGSVLNLPIQTAVKTGTSTDYRDAWTMGFDSRYVVGIWMGNLDRNAMDGVTGAIGPALALRTIFAELQRDRQTRPLFLSPELVPQEICLKSDQENRQPGSTCHLRTEYFLPGSRMQEVAVAPTPPPIVLSRPSPGLQMAYDPRIPASHQQFPFRIDGLEGRCLTPCHISWYLNSQLLATTDSADYRWSVQRGSHQLRAEVRQGEELIYASAPVTFLVK